MKLQFSRKVLPVLLFCVFSIGGNDLLSQLKPIEKRYMDQSPPVNKPERFPLLVQQGFFAAERIAISNDDKEIYYTEIKAYYPIRGQKIKMYRFSKGKWTGPFDLFDGYAPALSVEGDTMYFERKDLEQNSETYISVRDGKDWGTPKRILTGLDIAHYYQTPAIGSAYASSKASDSEGLNDWCRVLINGSDTIATSLGKPLNTSWKNLDFFVARDESYIIVTNRPRLGISFRKSDRSWTNPIYFGNTIDFGLGSWGPYVSPDNKYLFYTTGTKPDYSDVCVYWVRIDGIIDSLKQLK